MYSMLFKSFLSNWQACTSILSSSCSSPCSSSRLNFSRDCCVSILFPVMYGMWSFKSLLFLYPEKWNLSTCCIILLNSVVKKESIFWSREGSDIYGQAASNLVAGSNLEGTIQQIIDMGGGSWDRDTVVRALRAAYNNPERAVEYLYTVCEF